MKCVTEMSAFRKRSAYDVLDIWESSLFDGSQVLPVVVVLRDCAPSRNCKERANCMRWQKSDENRRFPSIFHS